MEAVPGVVQNTLAKAVEPERSRALKLRVGSRGLRGRVYECLTRFPSDPLIMRVPFSYGLGEIREPKKKKGKRVLLENRDKVWDFTLKP